VSRGSFEKMARQYPVTLRSSEARPDSGSPHGRFLNPVQSDSGGNAPRKPAHSRFRIHKRS